MTRVTSQVVTHVTFNVRVVTKNSTAARNLSVLLPCHVNGSYLILMPEIEWQIINVYNQEYESAAAFWPDVHGRIVFALVVSQLLLMGLLSTKQAANSTPLLITLPILTIWFHLFCKGRYEPAFTKHPLQVSPDVAIGNLFFIIFSLA